MKDNIQRDMANYLVAKSMLEMATKGSYPYQEAIYNINEIKKKYTEISSVITKENVEKDVFGAILLGLIAFLDREERDAREAANRRSAWD